MSRRRRDQHWADLEGALRAALHVAADSVEPAQDGLERIRAKISARQLARQAGWRALLAAMARWAAWLRLGPLGARLHHLGRLVVDRFRPDPGRAGRLGWLRPAAAIATGVFVVAAASWAITGLPQSIKPATNITGLGGGHGGYRSASGPVSPTRSRARPGTPTQGQTYYGGHSPSPTCTQGQGPQGASPTGSPTGSPSQSGSQSPSASPGSPSPTTSPTGTLSPSSSPTTAASAASSAGIVAALLASAVPNGGSPAPTAKGTAPAPSPGTSSPAPPATSPSPTASPSASSGPC